MLAEDEPVQRLLPEADGPQQRQLAAPLQYVAEYHYAKSHAAEEQAQAAEDGEDRKICVLHGVEGSQPFGVRSERQSHVFHSSRARAAQLCWICAPPRID